PARARHCVLPDLLEQLRDAAMGSVFVVVGPIRRENLVGLAAEQEIESLTEEAVKFLAELLIEIGHHPAAELEPPGRILGRSAGRLHDAVHGNLGADDDFPHLPACPATPMLPNRWSAENHSDR